jgi:FecR protein
MTMKRQTTTWATILLFGVSILGLGAIAGAQQMPESQYPEEIPPRAYPQQPSYPQQQSYPSQQGYPQQQDQPPAQSDPGAARISYTRGDVTTQHSDSGDWVAATVNTPVVNGDHVSTGQNARAEIQLDHANTLRLADQSTANVVNLSSGQIQLQVGQGLANYDVTKGSDASVEIDTPNVAIRPQLNAGGSYRILVNSDGETIVDVRNGSVDISTPQGTTHVDRDQRITIEGNADNAQFQISAASSRDEWDKWNNDRDHQIESASSWQHTNPYYTGSQDLDPYGQWNNVPDYGSVWFPTASPGWAPYRDGRWVFEPYYGWTWVSYEPWGWAPYHYGRWFVYGGNWGWWPGPVYGGYRPVWAPAYVSFIGFGGGGFGLSVGFGGGFGNIGWLPCGPGDRFYPWYGRGVNRVNVVNVYNIHNNGGGFGPLRSGRGAYSNVDRAFTEDRVREGVSSMPSNQFGRGRVPLQQQRMDAASFRQASVMTGANPIAPSRESFRPSDRQVSPSAIPNRAAVNQRFFSSTRQGTAGQPGFNRGGNTNARQPQQGNVRPGFQNFGSTNSGNSNRGSGQTSRPQQDQNQGTRGYVMPARPGNSQPSDQSRQVPTYSRGNSGNSEPSRNEYGRPQQQQNQGPRGTVMPSRPNYSQPAEPSRQVPTYSRGNPGNSEPSRNEYNRPPLNMQQPVVTPRTRNSAPAPTPPARSGGASGYSGGGNRGGSSSGNSRGGSSSGGHSSSGHDRR